MEVMENMINEEMVEMVQEAANTVVETQSTNGGVMKAIIENGVYALAVVGIWEGSKFAFKKAKGYLEAKRAANAADEVEVIPEGQDADNIVDIQ